MFARGVPLAPTGSIEDRVMREMVFRERHEKVAQVQVMAKIVSQVFGLDSERVFGAIVSEYASEVFQETYDADLLRQKIGAIRAAQARVRRRREHDVEMLGRLERMGDFYDRELGPGLPSGTGTRDKASAK